MAEATGPPPAAAVVVVSGLPHRKEGEGETAVNSQYRNNRKDKKHKHWRAAAAGACAGAMAKTVVAPIERVKLLMQLQSQLQSNTYIQKNSFQVVSMIYRHEGFLAFWRGNVHNVLQQAGTSALNFMFMDYYKALANSYDSNRNNSLYASFLSGGMAGGTATTILYPFQFLRTRLAADVGSTTLRAFPNGMRDVLQKTIQVDGIRGLYQGYGIALLGIFLYRSLHLGGYDAIKTILQRRQNHQEHDKRTIHPSAHFHPTTISWTEKIIAAQFVSLIAGTACYPIDSVRRRLMMQAGQEQEHHHHQHQQRQCATSTTTLAISKKPYRNAIHAFQVIFREEGVQGFYRGLGPNLVRSLGAALLLVSYDALQQQNFV